jgi:hypothetical protein
MKKVLPVLLFVAFITQANAQTRCECEYDDWVDDCDAEFERKGDWILFKSDTEQCSRIDWYTDSQPRLTIVEDGKETVNLMGIADDADISISSCKVCKDRRFDSLENHHESDAGRQEQEVSVGDKLVLSFHGDCWTEITDASGRMIFQEMGRAGEQKTIAGTAPFTVLLVEPNSVSITGNGQRVVVPASDGAAKFTIR